MANAISSLSKEIASAIEKLETELLPKASKLPGGTKDKAFLIERLMDLRKLHAQSLETPMFSVVFLGDTQNGKSTLINALLGKKVLPEGHTGACSSAIVRCRFREKGPITATFTYTTREAFETDLKERLEDAQLALEQEEETANRKEQVCRQLGRFLRLFDIDPQKYSEPKQIVEACRSCGGKFPEAKLLGTTEVIQANTENEQRIDENLSARGRTAFVVDECVIEGPFPAWHPQLELIDMPGTNACNPWDDQVNVRLRTRVSGLAMVAGDTQITNSVMGWFKESPILTEVAGASERNQVRVFVIKTFVDKLNLDGPADEEASLWEQTTKYCGEIEDHFRKQIRDLIDQRFSAQNEIKVLHRFAQSMPVHFVSAKVFRNLADPASRTRIEKNPTHPNNLELYGGFLRFDSDVEKTGVPGLRKNLWTHTDNHITKHHLRKLDLDFRKEVGRVADFFRSKRVGFERRLADEGAFVLEIDGFIQKHVTTVLETHREQTEKKLVALKERFSTEVEGLLDGVAKDFGKLTRKKLEDWMQLHWASLRASGRKNGQHTTSRGYEIDFNGDLADFCVTALNSKWIDYREQLRELVFDDLLRTFVPEIEKVIAQAKGSQDKKRIALVEESYDGVAERTRNLLELEIEKYNQEAEPFDALRPRLMESIRKFLGPTYGKIAEELGTGSSARMRNHLKDGILSSVLEITKMVRKVVKETWQGLTAAIETSANAFLDDVEKSMAEQHEHLTSIAEEPTGNDAKAATGFEELEQAIAEFAPKKPSEEKAA